MTYDIVIKNGTVIDPSQGIHAKKDIAVAGGKISAIEDSISDKDTHDVIEAEGLLVAPGLVDLHVARQADVAPLAVDLHGEGNALGVFLASRGDEERGAEPAPRERQEHRRAHHRRPDARSMGELGWAQHREQPEPDRWPRRREQ